MNLPTFNFIPLPHSQANLTGYVGGQIGVSALHQAKSLRINTVIDLLSDNETKCKKRSAKLAQAANGLMMSYHAFPVAGAQVTSALVLDQFAKLISQIKGNYLICCKTGTRAALIWGLHHARYSDATSLLNQLERAGFDFHFLVEEFEMQSLSIPSEAAA